MILVPKILSFFTRRDVMPLAWEIYRNSGRIAFGEALRQSWLQHRVAARNLAFKASNSPETQRIREIELHLSTIENRTRWAPGDAKRARQLRSQLHELYRAA